MADPVLVQHLWQAAAVPRTQTNAEHCNADYHSQERSMQNLLTRLNPTSASYK
jgi:hypothetical protein